MKTLVTSVISSYEVDMSGRLVILGKKGYCPWNSKNLTRIRRDEERHREAQEREQEKQADKASASRLSALKRTSNEGDGHVERFSLFEAEEEASFDASNKLHGSKSETSCHRKGTTRNSDAKNHQEFPSRRNALQRQSFNKHDKRSEFYLKPPSTNVPLGEKEIQRHRDMDPMKEFHQVQDVTQDSLSHREMVQNIKPDCDAYERKRSSKRHRSSNDGCSSKGDVDTEGRKEKHRKKKRRHREDARCHKHRKSSKSKKEKSSPSSNRKSTLSIEELREKRRKREEQERQRQDAFRSTENVGERQKTMERSRNLFHSTST